MSEQNTSIINMWLSHIEQNGGPSKCGREVFYLAREYEKTNISKAIEYYKLKVSLADDNIQERYVALLKLGDLSTNVDEKISYWTRGTILCPSRLECFHRLVLYYKNNKQYETALKIGIMAPENRIANKDDFMVEPHIYHHDFDIEFSVAAYYAGKYQLAHDINQRNMLRNVGNPGDKLKLIMDNQIFYTDSFNKNRNLVKLLPNQGPISSNSTNVDSRLSNDIRPNIIIVDGFYDNPNDVRAMALAEEFDIKGNYPGARTKTFATDELKARFESIIGKRITYWPGQYNGAFQFTVASEKSWIHRDQTDFSAIIYLSPDAPADAGTLTYRHLATGKQFADNEADEKTLSIDSNNYDAWEVMDIIGNKYNRCILFNGRCSHKSNVYFGNDKYSGRLFQTFFFDTEK